MVASAYAVSTEESIHAYGGYDVARVLMWTSQRTRPALWPQTRAKRLGGPARIAEREIRGYSFLPVSYCCPRAARDPVSKLAAVRASLRGPAPAPLTYATARRLQPAASSRWPWEDFAGRHDDAVNDDIHTCAFIRVGRSGSTVDAEASQTCWSSIKWCRTDLRDRGPSRPSEAHRTTTKGSGQWSVTLDETTLDDDGGGSGDMPTTLSGPSAPHPSIRVHTRTHPAPSSSGDVVDTRWHRQ
ncbi:hypothetical protein GGS23DRAFT_564599 [Durotheca rogersii]|uniref:uncharacterized protein n=1 Tax=Durotheca rogersii TaxID=419775 RepID=UPI00221F5F56|nr:uncharacterized protein GGS23DRAFT_564599 [Durotheca rogersii]KAI5863607.1 hypothetical protein GGS23DRAFT_564599 [Durotheca rogersii]